MFGVDTELQGHFREFKLSDYSSCHKVDAFITSLKQKLGLCLILLGFMVTFNLLVFKVKAPQLDISGCLRGHYKGVLDKFEHGYARLFDLGNMREAVFLGVLEDVDCINTCDPKKLNILFQGKGKYLILFRFLRNFESFNLL